MYFEHNWIKVLTISALIVLIHEIMIWYVSSLHHHFMHIVLQHLRRHCHEFCLSNPNKQFWLIFLLIRRKNWGFSFVTYLLIESHHDVTLLKLIFFNLDQNNDNLEFGVMLWLIFLHLSKNNKIFWNFEKLVWIE